MIHPRNFMIIHVVLALLVNSARADPTVAFDPPANSDGSASGTATIQFVSGKWQISVTKLYTDLISPFTITVRASQSEPIRFIEINQGAYSTSNKVYVHSHSQFNPCGDVGHIKANGTAPITLSRLFMNGTLGTAPYTGQDVIEGFDLVGGLEITGDVYGDIIASSASQNSIYEINGDLHGNLIGGWPECQTSVN